MRSLLTPRNCLGLALVCAFALAGLFGLLPEPSHLAAGLAAAPLLVGDTTEIKTLIDGLAKDWAEYKATNEQQITELKKGRSDPLLEEKLIKLSDRLDTLSAEKDELEKNLARPPAGPADESETKTVREFNLARKAAALGAGKPTPADVSAEEVRAYKAAFLAWFRKGEDFELDRKALSVGVDTEGGFLVPADMTGRIVTKLYDLSPIRQIASVQPISSDALEGIEDIDEAAAGWVGEKTSRTETDTPDVGKWRIPAEEMYAMPKATQRILDDAGVDVEAWLSAKVADKLARTEAAAFVAGNGVVKPRGFTTYTTAATADASRAWGQMQHVATGQNGAFASSTPADILFDVEMAMKPGYRAGARWVTRRSVLTLIRKFKDQQNQYLWQPGLQAGQPSSLIGYPVTEAEDMPALATGSLSLAFGNFQVGYQIVDRLGIRVLRDPYTAKPFVLFYTTKRTGGAVVNYEAIKFVKFGS